ncbi:MAG: preprotein translocase subunit SecE [bacterium]
MATEKKKFTARFAAWFRGMKAELKKVVWPSRKQVINNSAVVLAVVVSSSIVVWAFDWLASTLINLLISLVG